MKRILRGFAVPPDRLASVLGDLKTAPGLIGARGHKTTDFAEDLAAPFLRRDLNARLEAALGFPAEKGGPRIDPADQLPRPDQAKRLRGNGLLDSTKE